MPFLNPIIFWTALGAVSIPVAIHLLNRRRYRLMDWAAMQFLFESLKRNRRRLRIEELILLALRCLVLVVLGAVLARLTGCAAISALPGSESRTAVFVVDDSYSMGQRVGGGTLLAAAMTDIVEQIDKLADTDKLAILRTSDGDDADVFFKPTHMANAEREVLANRLTALKPTDGRARLDKALTAAARVFAEDKSLARRLYVYGDFRQADLAGAEATEAVREVCDELRKLDVEIVVMDFGRAATGNLTIESLEMVDRFAVAKAPTRLRLEVRNNGPNRVRDVEVKLTAKLTTAQGLRDVELPPVQIEEIDRRQTAGVDVTVTCPMGGAAVVTATLGPDELDGDNQAAVALDVRQAVSVLAVDGRLDLADPTAGESFFFAVALDPDRDGSEGAKVDVIGPAALADADLDEYDLIALLNVGDLSVMMDAAGKAYWPGVRALEHYVRAGGGLVIFTGDRVSPAFYNGPLYADGEGLSPLRIGQAVGKPRERKEYFRLDPKSIAAEGVMRTFQDYLANGVDPTQFIRFYAFTSASPSSAPARRADVKPPRVLARFADPDSSPAIAVRQFGRGNVLMVYTGATTFWTDWPADENGTYVALINDAVRYLAAQRSQGLSAVVGEPIVWQMPDELHDAAAVLKTPLSPAEPAVPLTPTPTSPAPTGGAASAPAETTPAPSEPDPVRRMELRFDRTRHAGTYTLDLALPDQSARCVLFTRQVDPAEGDLTCSREAGVTAAMGAEGVTYVDRAAGAAQVAPADGPKEYWTWALALLAVLLAAETFLAQRFGHWPAGGKGTQQEDLAQRTPKAQSQQVKSS